MRKTAIQLLAALNLGLAAAAAPFLLGGGPAAAQGAPLDGDERKHCCKRDVDGLKFCCADCWCLVNNCSGSGDCKSEPGT